MLIFDRGNDSNLHRILILVDVQPVGDTAQLNTYSNIVQCASKERDILFTFYILYKITCDEKLDVA